MRMWTGLLAAAIACVATCASAQTSVHEDTRAQYPAFLSNSYFTLNVGSIRYLFDDRQLEPGFSGRVGRRAAPGRPASISSATTSRSTCRCRSPTCARRDSWLSTTSTATSANTSGLDGVRRPHAGLGDAAERPVCRRTARAGWGVTSRSGFEIDGRPRCRMRTLPSGLLGAGLAYHATPNIDVDLRCDLFARAKVASPAVDAALHDRASLSTCDRCPASQVEDNRRAGFIFPGERRPAGVHDEPALATASTPSSREKFPMFWGGNVRDPSAASRSTTSATCSTPEGVRLRSRRSASYLEEQREPGSLPHAVRLSAASGSSCCAAEPADLYLAYSLAGPTFISRTVLDGRETG